MSNIDVGQQSGRPVAEGVKAPEQGVGSGSGDYALDVPVRAAAAFALAAKVAAVRGGADIVRTRLKRRE